MISLHSKINESSYGIFNSTLKNVNIKMDDQLKLPSTIIIGCESCGKSTLISNILKCDIFPIKKRLGTKMPIKLELIKSIKKKYIISFREKIYYLVKKEDILINIEKIMNTLNDNIIEDELEIKFYDPEVENNIFYDLPGIREYPQELNIITKKIVNKYLDIQNTLIICVIPINTTRITCNQALGMVIKKNKCENCIIVLSMTDLLHSSDYDELLINRLLKKNDELTNINIYSVVAITNKTYNETMWFESKFYFCIDKIKNNITTYSLLEQLNLLYSNYIRYNWKLEGLNNIKKIIKKYDNDYLELGRTNLTIDDIYDYIKSKLNFTSFTKYLHFTKKNIFNDLFKYIIKDYNINYKEAEGDINEFTSYYYNIKNLIIDDISQQINMIFKNDINLKLKRFEKFNKVLILIYHYFIDIEFNKLNKWFDNEISKLKYNLSSFSNFLNLNNLIQINIKRHINYYLEMNNFDTILLYLFDTDNIIFNEFESKNIKEIKLNLLVESEDYKYKRACIINELEKLNSAYSIISCIENYM